MNNLLIIAFQLVAILFLIMIGAIILAIIKEIIVAIFKNDKGSDKE